MKLSAEGLNPCRHYKTVQSGELGIGFALAVAERIVRKRYPGHSVFLVDADIALQAGWALVGKDVRRRDWVRQRPDFFLEAWKQGEPSKVVPLACKTSSHLVSLWDDSSASSKPRAGAKADGVRQSRCAGR
ncbi:hypothetical protein ACWGJV_35915 [Streptomyces tendae]